MITNFHILSGIIMALNFSIKGRKISKNFESQIIKNLNKQKIKRKIKKKISFIYPKNYFNFME